jgi:hypothetical protein
MMEQQEQEQQQQQEQQQEQEQQPAKRKMVDVGTDPVYNMVGQPAPTYVASNGALTWHSPTTEGGGGDTQYFLRWNARGDACLRRQTKDRGRNNTVTIPKSVWRRLVAEWQTVREKVDQAHYRINQAHYRMRTEGNEEEEEEEEEDLLRMERDWVLRVHAYAERLYVGLLRTDPNDPALILGGTGMNFYPEDFQLLVGALQTRMDKEEEGASPEKKRRRKQESAATNPAFHRQLYEVHLQRADDGSSLETTALSTSKLLGLLLEEVGGMCAVNKGSPFVGFPFRNASVQARRITFRIGPMLMKAVYVHCLEEMMSRVLKMDEEEEEEKDEEEKKIKPKRDIQDIQIKPKRDIRDIRLRAAKLITRPMLLQVASQVVNGTNCPNIANNAKVGTALLKAVLEFDMSWKLTQRDVDFDYSLLVRSTPDLF